MEHVREQAIRIITNTKAGQDPAAPTFNCRHAQLRHGTVGLKTGIPQHQH